MDTKQFTLRRLFIATSITSIALAVLSSIILRVDTAEFPRSLKIFFLILTATTWGILVMAWPRSRS